MAAGLIVLWVFGIFLLIVAMVSSIVGWKLGGVVRESLFGTHEKDNEATETPTQVIHHHHYYNAWGEEVDTQTQGQVTAEQGDSRDD